MNKLTKSESSPFIYKGTGYFKTLLLTIPKQSNYITLLFRDACLSMFTTPLEYISLFKGISSSKCVRVILYQKWHKLLEIQSLYNKYNFQNTLIQVTRCCPRLDVQVDKSDIKQAENFAQLLVKNMESDISRKFVDPFTELKWSSYEIYINRSKFERSINEKKESICDCYSHFFPTIMAIAARFLTSNKPLPEIVKDCEEGVDTQIGGLEILYDWQYDYTLNKSEIINDWDPEETIEFFLNLKRVNAIIFPEENEDVEERNNIITKLAKGVYEIVFHSGSVNRSLLYVNENNNNQFIWKPDTGLFQCNSDNISDQLIKIINQYPKSSDRLCQFYFKDHYIKISKIEIPKNCKWVENTSRNYRIRWEEQSKNETEKVY